MPVPLENDFSFLPLMLVVLLAIVVMLAVLFTVRARSRRRDQP